ncbi:hypothetical protein GCM10020331_057300 [Ectobacillus funiculus]
MLFRLQEDFLQRNIFPLEAVQSAYDKVFASGKSSLQYGLTEGYKPLREAIQTKMEQKGIRSTPDRILFDDRIATNN